MTKRILFFVILLTSFFIIKNLVVSIYTLWQKQDLITQASRELDEQKKRNLVLKEQYKKTHSPDFVETEARNKLFLVRPGEQEVVIPPSLLSASKSAQKSSSVLQPTWKQWLELFFTPASS